MTESNKFILYSVFHKPFIVPNSNIVQPIHAGKAIAKNDLGFMGDNEGENISALNPLFCELTVLYAIWKNKLYKGHDYWGLCHYRRYFTLPLWFWQFKKKENAYKLTPTQQNIDQIFSEKFQSKIESILTPNAIIVSKKWPLTTNKGVTINMKENYAIEHEAAGWQILQEVVNDLFPAYSNSFKEAELLTGLSIGNMMITHHAIWNEYLEWLFAILYEVKNMYTIPTDAYQSRALGFMSERLLNIFLHHNKNRFQIIEMDIVTFVQKKEPYVKNAPAKN